jgi:cell division protein FtsI/penicillin-binding protein 2
MGPALNWHMTRLDEKWPIPGMHYKTPYGRSVSDVHFYGPLVTWDVLVKSSNIGMSMLAERMGNPSLHLALARWGFGRPTGIELPGEDPGRLNPLRRWNKYSTESVAQGYEIMVTPLQLCRAFCAYANGGRLVQPTIIRGILDAQGKVSRENVGNVRFAANGATAPVIDPAVAMQLRRVMCDVPIRGTAAPTADNEGGRSDIWTIFGKTGTSARAPAATATPSSPAASSAARRPRTPAW